MGKACDPAVSSPSFATAAQRLGVRPGPLLMAATTLVFTLMVALVKVARAELSAMEIVLWRGVVGIPLAWLGLRGLRPTVSNGPVLVARVLLGFGAMTCFYTAAKGLPLADHTLITKVQPLLVAVLAPLLLGAGERLGPRIWVALALGLAGCGLLLAPDLQGGNIWGLWALAAAFFSAAAHICLRLLGRSDHPAVVVLWFQLAILPLSIILQLSWEQTLPSIPPLQLWPVLGGIGVLAVVGQTLMTRAYQLDRAALVAGASYTGPLWAVAGDLLFFATLPTWTTVIGGAFIVAAGLAVVFDRAPPVPPPEH